MESPLQAESAWEALRDGFPILELRPRYTWVEQAGRPDDARWASVRTRIGWQTLEYRGLRAVLEAIDVRRFADDGFIEYNSSPAAVRGGWAGGGSWPYGGAYAPGYYPLVADPETTDVNRLYLDYVGVPQTLVRFGRQAVRIDNQRFIGDYDAAQLPQVLNGVTLENTSLPHVRMLYGFYARVRNAYGEQASTRTHAVNARWEPAALVKLGGFAYFQDQPWTGSVTGFADNSNRIIGARLWGAWKASADWELLYNAELARQEDHADGDPRIDAPYGRIGAGVVYRRVFLRVDWERLGSNSGLYGFQTPLGSTQLFTGRADVFASTPPQGLRDVRGALGARFGKASVRLDYHRFRSDYADWDLGEEWDASLSWSFTPKIVASLEYADYRAGGSQHGFQDTRKVWASVSYNY